MPAAWGSTAPLRLVQGGGNTGKGKRIACLGAALRNGLKRHRTSGPHGGNQSRVAVFMGCPTGIALRLEEIRLAVDRHRHRRTLLQLVSHDGLRIIASSGGFWSNQEVIVTMLYIGR